MLKDLLTGIENLIDEHGDAVLLKERIGLLHDQLDGIEARNVWLQDENRRLQLEVGELARDLEKKKIPNQFVEYRGVLFRRLANGSLDGEVYCPDCRRPMASQGGQLPYSCSKCDVRAGFKWSDLESVMKDVP